MTNLLRMATCALIALAGLASPAASAQLLGNTLNRTTDALLQTTATVLPVDVEASGNHAHLRIGVSWLPLAEVSLDFQDATGLTASSLGATAQVVNLLDPGLLQRLPDGGLTQITSALPVLLTIEPPAGGGLRFRNTGRMEIHTHLLPYTQGSSLRVFKAPLLGPFRDVTDEIASGSVRARTTYGGFSQFLILVDLRDTQSVIDEKFGRLRSRVDTASPADQAALLAWWTQARSAMDGGDPDGALAALDALRAFAVSVAGTSLPNEWQANGATVNTAGEIVAETNTLAFSIAYWRDYGR